MKKRHLYVTGLVLLLVLAGLFGKDFLSSLEGRTSSYKTVTAAQYSLSASSPSGTHSAFTTDTVFVLEISGKTRVNVPERKKFFLSLYTDGNIDSAEGDVVLFYHEGNLVGDGTIKVLGEVVTSLCVDGEEVACQEAIATVFLDQAISNFTGAPETLEVVLNTEHFFTEYLNEYPKDGPYLNIFMSVDSQAVEGNTLYY